MILERVMSGNFESANRNGYYAALCDVSSDKASHSYPSTIFPPAALTWPKGAHQRILMSVIITDGGTIIYNDVKPALHEKSIKLLFLPGCFASTEANKKS